MDRKILWLWAFIILKFSIQVFLIHPAFDLHRDEYLHLDLGKHLAWGYTSVPPVTGWISYLILSLGDSLFWVKFFPALFGALTMVTVWKITTELKGGLFALILGAIAVTFSAIFRVNTLYQPNSLDILCWTLLYYTLIKYVNSNDRNWLWAMAGVFALGFLNKYNIAFLAIGLFPALLLTEQRKWFSERNIYLAILMAFLLISPNLLWQYQHDFPVLKHMAKLKETQLVNVNRVDFLKEQLLFFIGGLLVLLAGLVSFFTYPPFKKFRFIPLSTVFVLLLFIYLKGKAYYAIGLYPVLLAFGAVYLEYVCSRNWKFYLRPVLLLIPLLIFIRVLKIGFPIYSPQVMVKNNALYKKFGLLRWEDGKEHPLPQDFADMLGWKELAEKVDMVYWGIKDKKHTMIICDNYGEAGAINHYSKFKNMAAVSFNADYYHWFNLSQETFTLILVKSGYNKVKVSQEEKDIFGTIEHRGQVENPYAIEKGTRILLMSHPRIRINALLKKKLLESDGF